VGFFGGIPPKTNPSRKKTLYNSVILSEAKNLIFLLDNNNKLDQILMFF